MSEMQTFRHNRLAPQRPTGGLHLDPASIRRRVLDEQVELRWFREPHHSLLCYCASVALILGLGLGGVGLLSTADSLSGEWRLGAGTALCLLSLAVLLKQLLSSAIQDMNCVRSWRQIEWLKSGGRADPVLFLAVALALLLCGAALVGAHGARGGGGDMLVSGLVLAAAGGAVATAVAVYAAAAHLQRKREERRRRRRRRRRLRAVWVFSVSGRQMEGGGRAFSSRTNLI